MCRGSLQVRDAATQHGKQGATENCPGRITFVLFAMIGPGRTGSPALLRADTMTRTSGRTAQRAAEAYVRCATPALHMA